MPLKRSRRTSVRLHSAAFEITPLERRVLMSSGQLFVGSSGSGGAVGEYDGTGGVVNAALVSPVSNPTAIAVSGANVFVVNGTDTVSEYTNTGTLVNAALIQQPEIDGIAIVRNHIFLSDSSSGLIGEYTTDGAVVNASLISDNSHPQALAVSGPNLFVVDAASNSVGEYTLLGATVNTSLFTAGGNPTGIAVSGSNIFVADGSSGSIGEYTTGGATVNASLISGLISPQGLSTYRSNLYVADISANVIGQYTTSGATVNAAFISGLSNPVSVFAVGPASQLVVHAVPGSATAGSALSPAVVIHAEDDNGAVDSLETSSVTIAIATGPTGAVLGGTTTVAMQGGTATFSDLTLSKSGTDTLTATDGSLTAATTTSISVQAGPAAKLNFGQSPTGTTTGTAITPAVTVDVQDANGNLATIDTSSVVMTIASGPAGAVLGGTTTVTAVGGVATFSTLTLSTAGTYTLTASDGFNTPVTSGSFTITAPAANKLAFAQQPASGTTTSVLAPVKINVQNSGGALLTGDTSNVTLAIATGPAGAALGGTTTVAAVAGVATFSNLTLTTAGTYTLTATDGSDTSATSTNFTILVPGPNQVVFSAQPQSTTTHTFLAPVKVNVENASGTLITNDTSNVSLTVSTSSSGASLGSITTVAAVGGVATFSNLTFATAGTYTLSASDGGDTSATSVSFTITAPGVNRLAFATQPQSATASATLPAVKVNVQNSSGTLLAGDTSTVTLSIATGPAGATLGGTLAVAAVAGVATFSNLTFATPGNYTLTATDGTDTSATSVSFTISPPLANKLAFATQPVNATPSTGLGNITIDVENHSGTLLVGDHSTVTLTIATGTAGATLGGTTTVTAVNGVATFSDLFITTPGTNYTLTVSDGTDVPATSAVFSIAAAPSTPGLTFATEPVNTDFNSTLGSITVDVTDSTGALITTDSGNVTLSITGNPGGAALGGTITAAAVNGVATFSNLTINKIGSYTLTATENGHTSADSTLFNVYYPPVTVGQLDPTFGSAGLVQSNVGFTSTAGTANDGGQIVVIGTTGAVPAESFSIARYNADGTLDTAFGTQGVSTIHFANTDDVPAAVAVLPGGQILIAGTATTYLAGAATTSQFAVTRLTANGALDTSFGAGTGEVQFGFSTAATHDVLTSMVVSSSGVIYLGGRSDSRSTTGNDFAIIALDPAGTPHATFGAGGQMLIDFANGSDTINSLALQKNGDLVAAGSASVAGVTDIALARMLPSGVLDRHFGTGGQVTTSVRGIFDSATSVAIQPKGQIVIGGLSAAVTAQTSTTDFVVARYSPGGKLDRSFGGGAVVTSFSGSSAVTNVMVQADGRIVATGKLAGSLTSIVSNQLEVAIARYTTRGLLDSAFDGSGKAVIDLSTATFTTSGTLPITPPPLDAATLATEADQLIASGQGAAVLNAASEILTVGNSGADTVEAEVITRGVDLSAAVITQLPAAVAGGTKSFANVQITENGGDIAKGTVTINLEITTDAQGNGATVVKTVTERINLAGGHSHTYKIPFVYPTNLPAGSYYLLANVAGDGTPAMRELNQLNNLSPAVRTIAITPPFITLAGSALSTSSPFTRGKPARIEFTLTNNGNVVAKGKTEVDLYLSTDQTLAHGTLEANKLFALSLKPGASHLYRQSFVLPKTLARGTYTLIAVVDPAKSLGTIDQTSSTVIDPTRLTIA